MQRTQIEKYGSEEEKLNLKIRDKLKAIDAEFDKINVKEDWQRVFVELSRENAKRDAIDEIMSQSKADLRSPSEEGNSIADSFEKTVRFFVDGHPVYRFLPESAKQQLVNFGVGIGKGTVGLAGAATGYANFYRDIITDITIAGAEKVGMDVGRLKNAVEISRRNEQKQWEQILNARTAEMARGDFGYQAKKDNGIRTTVYDTPNWAVNAGDMTAQALPFLVVGAVTGGASIGVQIGAAAATGAATGLGSDYIRTRNTKTAIIAAGIGAAQGAAGPISGKLPFPADVAANAALGYIVAKVQNPNADDAQIMQSIIMQTAQSGAFKIGSELHQRMSQKAGRTLSSDEMQTEFGKELAKNFETVKTETAAASAKQAEGVVKQIQVEAVAKDLEGVGKLTAAAQKAIREAAADWGSKNKVFTKSAYDSVSLKNLTKGTKGIIPGMLPVGAATVLAVKAGYHVEAGARSFTDFARIMRAEAKSAGVEWKAVRGQLENLYRETIDKFNQTKPYAEQTIISEKEIAKVKVEWRAEDLNEVIGISKREDILTSGRTSRKDLKRDIYQSRHDVHNYKHMTAKTEEEARIFSMTGNEYAQFLPNINVENLEITGMQDALSKGNILRKDANTYYLFYKTDNIVGYDLGISTRWIRIEFTSGKTRHSQPIAMYRLRKYLPKAEE